jgi:hypothetical protein
MRKKKPNRTTPVEQPTYFTKVGKSMVPVYGAEQPTLLAFLEARRGKGGIYAFWTAEYKKPDANGSDKVWGRAKVGLPAGDRFDRMAVEQHTAASGRSAYARTWRSMRAGSNVKLIRPSTDEEVYRWLKTHTHKAFGRFKPVEIVTDVW